MKILYSKTSSQGNCSVIESGNGKLLIIDAGIPYKKVDKEIGYRLHEAEALLITHAHSDHTGHISDFLSSGINTHLGVETASALEIGAYSRLIHELAPCAQISLSDFMILPLEMHHTNSDGTPCECLGYLILDKSTGEKMLWATDTLYIKNRFPPLDFYCIEANFFESDDYTNLMDAIEKSVEMRRVQSHMSFESALKFISIQDLSKCKEIRLLHLSSSLSEKQRKAIKAKFKRELKKIYKGDIKVEC